MRRWPTLPAPHRLPWLRLPLRCSGPRRSEFQLTHRRWGELALLQPVALQTLTIALTVSVALILTFLCLAQYARKESVPGYLRPAGGTAKIYLPQAGIIRAVHVAEGDHVAENQPLLTVETAQFSGTGDDVNLALIRTLKEQRAVLSKQIEAEGRRTASERERLTALIKGLETEIGLFNDQVRLQTDRIKLARRPWMPPRVSPPRASSPTSNTSGASAI
ncbi:hypothetical protein ACU4GR_02035 [Methylobacterium oryzae CBMB20]